MSHMFYMIFSICIIQPVLKPDEWYKGSPWAKKLYLVLILLGFQGEFPALCEDRDHLRKQVG